MNYLGIKTRSRKPKFLGAKTANEFTPSGRSVRRVSDRARRFADINVLIPRLERLIENYELSNEHVLKTYLIETRERYLKEQKEINQEHCQHDFVQDKCFFCEMTKDDFDLKERGYLTEDRVRCPLCGQVLKKFVAKDGTIARICMGKHSAEQMIVVIYKEEKKRPRIKGGTN